MKIILKAINVNNVDYFSLDIEGGEIEVIKGLDFKKINITVLQIENQSFLKNKLEIEKILFSNNFGLLKEAKTDTFYFQKNKKI
jgi:hypothetical protein